LPDHHSPLGFSGAILVPGQKGLTAGPLIPGKLPEVLEFIMARIIPLVIPAANLVQKNHKIRGFVAKAPQR
jgi:hypothetical protein